MRKDAIFGLRDRAAPPRLQDGRTSTPHRHQGATTYPRLPVTAWAVLGLLSFRDDRTGYDLKKWADASLRFFYWSPAISQIYAELRRLEELGLVTSRRSGPEEPRAKRRYTITPDGRDALTAWAESTHDCGPPVLKHPLVLRIWLGHLAVPGTLRTLVERHRDRTRAALREVREALSGIGAEREGDFPRVALGWSERQHLAELELAEAMLADLERLGCGTPEGARRAADGRGRSAPPAPRRQHAEDAPTHG
ncbi:PadR family transcriptional regulator [Streptomyces sp. NPDC047117]|uniref:PadR family transcriptional regulator n=1 Tax=Streptomyces sp. NPDC047117 TaxID=3155379 RepID=UPI0033F0B16C